MRLLRSSKLGLYLIVVVVASCPCMLIAGITYDIGPFGHDRTYIPDYPGAQQERVLIGAQIPTPVPPTDPKIHYIGWDDKMVTFVTNDSPQRVLTFYKDAMMWRIHEGWQLGDAGQTAYSLSMLSHGHSDSSPPIYTFYVDTEQVGTRTYVTVTRGMVPGL